jgi:hypothetical protein
MDSQLLEGKNRNFLNSLPLENVIQKLSVYFSTITRKIRANIISSHIIQKYSEYRPMDKPPKKLIEQVRDVIRLKHYSYKTEKITLIGLNAIFSFIINAIPKQWGKRN